MHFVAALDRVEGMRRVLGLFEGVVTGAADGYARMIGTPAATLLHLGPGIANGLANIHNANKASTPMVNIVGDHATYHRRYDAPLEEKWLKEQLDRIVSKRELETLRDFTNPRNIVELHKIGSAAAAAQIQMDHFPDEFKVETATS